MHQALKFLYANKSLPDSMVPISALLFLRGLGISNSPGTKPEPLAGPYSPKRGKVPLRGTLAINDNTAYVHIHADFAGDYFNRHTFLYFLVTEVG